MFKLRQKIYLGDWLLLKPYKSQVSSDVFYLQLSNQIKSSITKQIDVETLERFFDDALNLYACFIVSYLEDNISETNLWNTFVKIHKQLYGFQIPLYDLSEHYEDEINLQDVQFLTWYFVKTVDNEAEIEPNNDIVVQVSTIVMNILDDAWDDAPENNKLQAAYQLDETTEIDFEAVQYLIENILYESYLFYIDTGSRFVNLVRDQTEKEQLDATAFLIISSEIKDILTFTENTKLLALKGKIWAAELVGNKHPQYQNLINVSERYSNHFYYTGKDEHHFFFERVLSERKININKTDFEHDVFLKKTGTQFLLTIFQCNNKFIAPKIPIKNNVSKSEIAKDNNIFNDFEVSLFVSNEKDTIEAILNDQLEAFCAINDGQQILFILSEDVEDCLNNFYECYNSLFSKPQNQHSKFCIKDNLTYYDYKIEDSADLPALIYFNPKRGIEVQVLINSAFPLDDNPFYFEEDSEEEFIFMIEQTNTSQSCLNFA